MNDVNYSHDWNDDRDYEAVWPRGRCEDLLYAAAAPTNLEVALRLAGRGIPVFPCRPEPEIINGKPKKAKTPLTPHSFQDATRDPLKIQRWWGERPSALVGMPTGHVSGVYIVDPDAPTDGRPDGLGAWGELEAKHGELETFTVRSANGGRHFYLQHEAGYTNSSGGLPPGIDVRGEGGFVIAPGCRLPDGRGWTIIKEAGLRPLPDWLKGVVQPKWETEAREPSEPGETPAGRRELASICLRLSATPNGRQYKELYRLAAEAGSLVGAGDVDLETARAELLAAGESMANFKPQEPWDERELRRVIDNGLRTGQRQPCCAPPTAEEWRAEQEERTRELLAQLGMELPLAEPQPTRPVERVKPPKPTGKHAEIVCAADIIMRPMRWVWEGHLLRGAQELLTGLPGLGKSQVQIDFVARVTAGLNWPDGAAAKEPANVIMLTAEDTLDQVVVPRLTAAGADLKRVLILKSIKIDEKTQRQFLLAEDLLVLEKVVREFGNVALITVDPITAYMGGKIDSHKTTEVRSQLGPLKDFAERMDVPVCTITHPPKSASQRAIDHYIGSQAFIAAGRIGHLCIGEMEPGEDPKPTGRILFTMAKTNHIWMPTLAYRIEQVVVGQDPDTHDIIAAPHVVWAQEAVAITADQAVAASNGGASPHFSRGRAIGRRFRRDLKAGFVRA
jgi:putative DNA primase/helicase